MLELCQVRVDSRNVLYGGGGSQWGVDCSVIPVTGVVCIAGMVWYVCMYAVDHWST